MTVTLNPFSIKWLELSLGVFGIPLNDFFLNPLLHRLVSKQKFDLNHVLEPRNAGCMLLNAKLTPILPIVLITNLQAKSIGFNSSLAKQPCLPQYISVKT